MSPYRRARLYYRGSLDLEEATRGMTQLQLETFHGRVHELRYGLDGNKQARELFWRDQRGEVTS